MKKLLKRLLMCIVYMFSIHILYISANAQIVNNSGTAYADSIGLPFFVLDSSGNMTNLTDGDSVFIFIWSPGGSKVFRDTVTYNDALLDTAKISLTGTRVITFYNYHGYVPTLDGTTGRDGWYNYAIMCERDTGQVMATPFTGGFQLYQTRDFNAFADFVDAAITSRMATYTQPTGFLAATFPSGTIANTTNITGGTITTASNLTTNNDKTGYALSAAGVDAIWDDLKAGHVTDGTFGKYLDTTISSRASAAGSGATKAEVADTVKAMMAVNPHIVSGRQVQYFGTVKATPGTTGFSATGGNIDLAKLNDFYNQSEIIFFSGDLRGKPITVVDWVTATDSFAIDVNWGAQTPIAPAIGDSFVIVGQPAANVWAWSGSVISEATSADGTFYPRTDIMAIDNNTTAPNNLATAFGVGASFAGTNWRLGNVTTVDSLYTSGARKITDLVADTGQDLNWDGTPIPAADSSFFSRMLHRIVHGTQVDANADTSTLAQRDVDVQAVNGDATAADNLGEAFDADDVGSKMQLSQLKIVATPTEDTSVIIRSTGLSYGMFIASDSGSAIRVRGNQLAGNGSALHLEGFGTGTAGALRIDASGAGGANAIQLASTSGDLIQDSAITVGTLTGDAAQKIAARTMGMKLGTVTSAPTTTTFKSTAFTEADGYWTNNMVRFLNGTAINQVAEIDTFVASVDSFKLTPALSVAPTIGDSFVVFSILAGQSAGGAGGNPAGGWIDSVAGGTLPYGSYVRGFYVIDTSGTDDSIPTVSVCFSSNGVNRGCFLTDADGFFKINMPAGTWVATATEPGYVLIDTSFTVSGADTLDIRGYNISVGTPSAANLSRVYGYLRTIEDKKIDGAVITATLHTGKNQADSTGEAVIVTDIIGSAASDSTGYFYIDLRRTNSYADTTRGFYDLKGTWNNKSIFEITRIRIPNSGNLNLGDTLASRQ